MRIKKTSNTRALAGKVLNVKNNSSTDAYSCNYINEKVYNYDMLESGSSIDNITSNGIFVIFNATGTLPSGYTSDNNIFIQSMMWDSDWGRQILYDIRSNNTYTRQKLNGAWQSWVSLL